MPVVEPLAWAFQLPTGGFLQQARNLPYSGSRAERLSYAWRDVVAIRLSIVRARERDIQFIAIKRFGGGTKRVPVNTIIGGHAAVETWIGDAQAWLRRPRPVRGRAPGR